LSQESKDKDTKIERMGEILAETIPDVESYEAVLREEFELMRKQYEKRLATCEETLQRDMVKNMAERQNLTSELDKLRSQNQAIGQRLIAVMKK